MTLCSSNLDRATSRTQPWNSYLCAASTLGLQTFSIAMWAILIHLPNSQTAPDIALRQGVKGELLFPSQKSQAPFFLPYAACPSLHSQPNQSQVHGHQRGLKRLLFAEGRGKTRDPEKPRAASGLSRKLMHPLFSRLESLTKALSQDFSTARLFPGNLKILPFSSTQVVPYSFPNWTCMDLALPLAQNLSHQHPVSL